MACNDDIARRTAVSRASSHRGHRPSLAKRAGLTGHRAAGLATTAPTAPAAVCGMWVASVAHVIVNVTAGSLSLSAGTDLSEQRWNRAEHNEPVAVADP